jgi:hypothetical protein
MYNEQLSPIERIDWAVSVTYEDGSKCIKRSSDLYGAKEDKLVFDKGFLEKWKMFN